MSDREFETLKAIVKESSWVNDTNIDVKEEPEGIDKKFIKSRLTDGDNLIDLYIDCMNDSFDEEEFWKIAKSVMVGNI